MRVVTSRFQIKQNTLLSFPHWRMKLKLSSVVFKAFCNLPRLPYQPHLHELLSTMWSCMPLKTQSFHILVPLLRQLPLSGIPTLIIFFKSWQTFTLSDPLGRMHCLFIYDPSECFRASLQIGIRYVRSLENKVCCCYRALPHVSNSCELLVIHLCHKWVINY